MKSYPVNGRFGEFGGQFVPETLVPALQELESAYLRWKSDAGFRAELDGMLREYAGRPTPLYFARNLTKRAGGAMIFLKREDLLHGGAHKINNRNLDTLEVSLDTSYRLLGSYPRVKPVVCESGIKTRKEAVSLIKAGANALLIGSTLMRSRDPTESIRRLAGA